MGARVARAMTCGGGSMDRRGVALLSAVIVGAAVALLSHAALLLGLAMATASRASVQVAQERAGADVQLAREAAGLQHLDDSLATGLVRRRLTPELLRVVAGSAPAARVGLLWAPDVQTRLDALSAGVVTGIALDATTVARLRQETADPCPPGVYPRLLPLGRRRSPVDAAWDQIGPFRGDAWGILPAPPRTPPADGRAFRADGDLTLAPGSWRGVLIVQGDLTLSAGATFTGYVAARTVRLRGGSRLTGVVSAEQRVIAEGTATVGVAPCAAAAAISESSPLDLVRMVLPDRWSADVGF